jgi:hypothetical protein
MLIGSLGAESSAAGKRSQSVLAAQITALNALARSWEGEAPSEPDSAMARREAHPPRIVQGYLDVLVLDESTNSLQGCVPLRGNLVEIFANFGQLPRLDLP